LGHDALVGALGYCVIFAEPSSYLFFLFGADWFLAIHTIYEINISQYHLPQLVRWSLISSISFLFSLRDRAVTESIVVHTIIYYNYCIALDKGFSAKLVNSQFFVKAVLHFLVP